MVEIVVERIITSYDFKADPDKPDSFSNNWNNNSIDTIALIERGSIVFKAYCQTVANYCFGDMKTADTVPFGDTIAPGPFAVRCFVPPRNFHGEIHAIIHTRDIDGQWINHEAMQITRGGFQNGRFLIHDRYSFALGRDTNYAWSAGCFILSSADLHTFNSILKGFVTPNDIVVGSLIEIAA